MSWGDSHPLADYFYREIQHLRRDGVEFAKAHPEYAQALGLSAGVSADPHVEMLLQGVAYLTGRLNYRLDVDRNLLPAVILDQLYPHLVSPLPAMVMAQVNIQPDGANFRAGWQLARGRNVFIETEQRRGDQVRCRFQVACDTPLWPLAIKQINWSPLAGLPAEVITADVVGGVHVTFVNMGEDPVQTLPLSQLRFYLAGNTTQQFKLYELLHEHIVSIWIKVNEESSWRKLSAASLVGCGFSDEEALLLDEPTSFSGYRLLQEYFAFPERFLLFDIKGLELAGATDQFQLLLLSDTVLPEQLHLTEESLKLNCVPLVNLFKQHLDPLRMDHHHYEYRLVADYSHHSYCEVVKPIHLEAFRPGQPVRKVESYFELSDIWQVEDDDYFYLCRRELSQRPDIPGTELWISLLDPSLSLTNPVADTLSGSVWSTNRTLPEQLRQGDALQLEGAGPVNHLTLLMSPTAYHPPPLLSQTPWLLLAQVNNLHLSLHDSESLLANLCQLLLLHGGMRGEANRKQITSIQSIKGKSAVQRMGNELWRGFCQGIELTMTVNETQFGQGSPLLLGEILQHVLARYVSSNHFVSLVLHSKQRKGLWKRWPAQVGEQLIL
ncbi:type VI secretion system baseplate subunit TssF [Zooshikella ganghwensis]|uniref:type VI secretion system baseplate subunit TssF n=1 Tax=Zooshikella ganghwensis TaxID=202772 RepID=UPI0004075C2B|nr:type VI secretion system baseplate subunit TssF [Zooshikella ganghwensis]